MDEGGVSDNAIGPIWGAQICYVSTVHPKMTRVETEQGTAIIACCDRPVVFYEANESIEMHYLAFNQIRQISHIYPSRDKDASTQPLLLYEDKNGMVHFCENDGLRRLEAQRMMFKLQISKTLLVPSNDSIVVLLEQPDLDFIDNNKDVHNVVGLVSRSTMQAKAIFRLDKAEIANCAYSVEVNQKKWILIGTTFLKPEEQLPSNGRLILLDSESFELVQ